MNDTLREYLSYGSFLIPLLTFKKTIQPEKVQWGGKSQYFLYFPSPEPVNDTLIIYLHGGGWNSHSPEEFAFIGEKFALEGYDCVLPSYRKTPRFRYKNLIYDVFAGYCAIRKHLSEKRTYKKVIVIGSSAGAHLGALLCYDSFLQNKFSISPDEIDGFISLAGPLCFDSPYTFEFKYLISSLFHSSDSAMWKKGEPVRKLKQGQQTKCMIIQSRHDGVVEFDQSHKFYQRACELGIPAEFYEVIEKQDTHSAYCAGIFLKEKTDSPTLEKVFETAEKFSK